MINTKFTIENLIEIVKSGGRVKTGVDVYNSGGRLLLAKDTLVDKVKPLILIQNNGIRSLPVAAGGGLWDSTGRQIRQEPDGSISFSSPKKPAKKPAKPPKPMTRDVEPRLREIQALRQETIIRYDRAKACLKQAIEQIRKTKGLFDVQAVQSRVSEMVGFSVEAGHPFPYLGRELFSHEDYLYGHAANVCAVGTAVLHRFNTNFSRTIENALWTDFLLDQESGSTLAGHSVGSDQPNTGFAYYFPDDLKEISLGFFICDIGKALVPESILNKPDSLTPGEFDTMKRHSFDFGIQILEKNHLNTPMLSNMVKYHHGPLFQGEPHCYPDDRDFSELPPYVRICKLADIYDAMISKRSYRDALNQVTAVTQLFRTYVKKDSMLQYILHAFVKSIGIHPPGSIVFLKNGQMAYVLESQGPIVLPFTDISREPLAVRPDPVDLSQGEDLLQVDADKSIQTPRKVYDLLPDYIRTIAMPS